MDEFDSDEVDCPTNDIKVDVTLKDNSAVDLFLGFSTGQTENMTVRIT